MLDYTRIYEDFVKGEMGRLYELMYPGLLLYAARTLGDELAYMAEDCVQDAVMATYVNRGTLEDAVHWRRYLIMSVHNRALKQLRHQSVRDSYSARVEDEDEMNEQDVSHEMIRQETLDMLYAAIDELPEMYRVVFELSFEQGLKNAEIAAMLDVAEITVKKRKERMIEMLRRRMGDEAVMAFLLLSVEMV